MLEHWKTGIAFQLNQSILHAQLMGFIHLANVHLKSLISKLHLTAHDMLSKLPFTVTTGILGI